MSEQTAPTPADGGLRQAVEALADEWDNPGWRGGSLLREEAGRALRAALAAHSAPTPVGGQDGGLAEVIAAHWGRTADLGTPRQYTQHGNWNQNCTCGYPLSDDDDEAETEQVAHIADAIRAAGWVKP